MKRWACHACTASGTAATSAQAREAFLRHWQSMHQEVDF